MLSSEQTLNEKKSRKTKKSDKPYTHKEKKKNKEAKEEQQSQIKKLPKPVIYDPDKDQRNIRLAMDSNSFKQDQEQIIREAKEITNYYLELHKNLINTYNSINSQILQDISNFSW